MPDLKLYRVFLSTVTNKFGLRGIKMFQIKILILCMFFSTSSHFVWWY